MTNTEKPKSFYTRSGIVRIDSGVITTGGSDAPKKISLRIEIPGVGMLGTSLTGDEVLALLTGSTFEVAAALRTEVEPS